MTEYKTDNPLIVQSDRSILLEVDNPHYSAGRDALVAFAELEKSPEHIHTYRVTPLSVWNACAAGHSGEMIIATLKRFSKYPPPSNVLSEIGDYAARYGRIAITREQDELVLSTDEATISELIARDEKLASILQPLGKGRYRFEPAERGRLKQMLIKMGFPADDQAGYCEGEALQLDLRSETLSGKHFAPRRYQSDAAESFHASGSPRGGAGVIVLPCGAGKTIVGMSCIDKLQSSTLILATNLTAVRQWVNELLDKTTLRADQIGEYAGAKKEIRPVTVATYQIMTHRKSRDYAFTHLELFNQRDWGLIIYDEVHLLPAPVFQVTATIQARRRLGLTATLVREDGREDDVFALIGPKKYDLPWKILEEQGWIATARCEEIRIGMSPACRTRYATSSRRRQFRVASENPAKLVVVQRLLREHAGDSILILGMYVDQLKQLAKDLKIPVLTGSTSQRKREKLFGEFRSGKRSVLACSKIANFSLDMPDASVAMQISGTFGSRQEEAQRLGRILRPKPGENQAHFYSLVSQDTVEQDFAMNRQLFLCEQGYEYKISHQEAGR